MVHRFCSRNHGLFGFFLTTLCIVIFVFLVIFESLHPFRWFSLLCFLWLSVQWSHCSAYWWFTSKQDFVRVIESYRNLQKIKNIETILSGVACDPNWWGIEEEFPPAQQFLPMVHCIFRLVVSAKYWVLNAECWVMRAGELACLCGINLWYSFGAPKNANKMTNN